jgi:phosphoserine phosphatase
VDPFRKDRAYRRLLRGLGLNSKQTIAVGDTVYDLAFLKSARIGFMLAHTTRVDTPGIIHIDKLTDIFAHI